MDLTKNKIEEYKRKCYDFSRRFFESKIWKWFYIGFAVYDLYKWWTGCIGTISTIYLILFGFFGSVYLLGKYVWYAKPNNTRNTKSRNTKSKKYKDRKYYKDDNGKWGFKN